MTVRRPSDYTRRDTAAPLVAGAVDVSEPVAGFYRCRLGANTVTGGVRLWFGPPHDPVTGDEMDRSWRWQALWNGDPVDFDRVWPRCAGDPISEAEYQRYVARQVWARENAPASAYAERGRAIDRLSRKTPLPF